MAFIPELLEKIRMYVIECVIMNIPALGNEYDELSTFANVESYICLVLQEVSRVLQCGMLQNTACIDTRGQKRVN